ncbi:MAG TPA: hypothetical protein VMV68_00865, partial [Spirochaetia bacterium]|nr:hypothetical protein [Spirochaetia bacterium]
LSHGDRHTSRMGKAAVTVRRIFAIASIMITLLAAGASAQEVGYAKVPQRVFFPPLQSPPAAHDPAYAMVPDYLYTAICALQPIVRAAKEGEAQSIVQVVASTVSRSLSVRLIEGGKVVDEASFTGGDNSALTAFVDATARRFAPHLESIAPRIDRVAPTTSDSGVDQELVRRVEHEDALARPIELSLSAAGLMRFLSGSSANGQVASIQPTPVVFDFAWYPDRGVGIDASVLTYYGTALSFGRTQTNGSVGLSRSFLVLPGIGVRYRSLGDVFAAFSAIFYGGYGYVTNIASDTIGSYNNSSTFVPFLSPGQSRSIFFMLIRLATDVGYVINDHFSVDGGITLSLNPRVFASASSVVPTDGNDAFMQYLTLGVVYRP